MQMIQDIGDFVTALWHGSNDFCWQWKNYYWAAPLWAGIVGLMVKHDEKVFRVKHIQFLIGAALMAPILNWMFFWALCIACVIAPPAWLIMFSRKFYDTHKDKKLF